MFQQSLLITGALSALLWATCVDESQAQKKALPPEGVGAQGSLTWAGARLVKADMELQQKLGLADKEGMVIAALEPSCAAEKAGLKVNDVLVRINGTAIPSDLDGFNKVAKEQKLDKGADLVIVRDGKEETLKSAKLPAAAQFNAPPSGRRGFGGIGGFGGKGGIRIFSGNINGTKINRKQVGDEFFGDYAKGDLKITIAGKLDDAMTISISITQGDQTKKYTSVKDVPADHQRIVQQLMPAGR